MALIFLDSFDHYSNAQASRKWTSWGGGGAITTSGRTGSGVGLSSSTQTKTLDGIEYADLTVGAAYKANDLSGGIFQFTNALTGMWLRVLHVGDGRVHFHYNPPNDYGPAASTFVLNADEWYYVEVNSQVSIVNTGGNNGTITFDTQLWVNGDSVLSETLNVNITNYDDYEDHCAWATIGLMHGSGSTSTYDDLYVTDGERLGDIKVYVLYPDGAGDETDWTPTGAANNWDAANEHPADDDTSYVSSPTADDEDLYNLDDIGAGFSGTIKGAQALWLVKKEDMGAGATAGLWKSGATTDQGENFYPSATNYLYDRQAERKSLFTGLDWTESEINALQLGIKRVV